MAGIANFIPEYWAKKMLSILYKELVYAAPGIVNRDYEGDISEAGDTVHIMNLNAPTISNYVANVTEISPEQLTTGERALTIDQSKYFAFYLDDVDKRQAAGDLVSKQMEQAAYGLRDTADQYVAGLYTGVTPANLHAAEHVADGDDAYEMLLWGREALNTAKVAKEGRYVTVPSWITGLLLTNTKFVANPALSQSGANLINGEVGYAAGFTVRESENVPTISGDDKAVQFGTAGAITYAEQINKVEKYRPEKAFSDAVKGLHLYGAKLVRPDGIAVFTASRTAV